MSYRRDVGRSSGEPVVELGEGEAPAFGAIPAGVRHRHERALGRLEGVGELQLHRGVALHFGRHLVFQKRPYRGVPKNNMRSGVGGRTRNKISARHVSSGHVAARLCSVCLSVTCVFGLRVFADKVGVLRVSAS